MRSFFARAVGAAFVFFGLLVVGAVAAPQTAQAKNCDCYCAVDGDPETQAFCTASSSACSSFCTGQGKSMVVCEQPGPGETECSLTAQTFADPGPVVISETSAPKPKRGSIFIPECAFSEEKTPDLNCALTAFLGISRFILSIVGSVTLLIFVYAGFVFIKDAGNAKKAGEAMGMITNAAIGLVIVLCSGIMVNYFQTKIRGKDDSGCYALGSGYACMEKGGGINCKTGLCQANSSASYQCCQPNTAEFRNKACKDAFGSEFGCVNASGGTECKRGYCPGDDSIQCCRTSAPAGALTTKNSTGCSNLATGKFLGCMDSSNANGCQDPSQGLCVSDGAGINCLETRTDIRCTQTVKSNAVYGCYDTSTPTKLFVGCAEVSKDEACFDVCSAAGKGTVACGLKGPSGRQPDPGCYQ